MHAFCVLLSSRRAAGGPDVKATTLAQPLFGLRDPVSLAEDHKLIRPVDPSKNDYYWKPLPQEAIALAQGFDPKKVNTSFAFSFSLPHTKGMCSWYGCCLWELRIW